MKKDTFYEWKKFPHSEVKTKEHYKKLIDEIPIEDVKLYVESRHEKVDSIDILMAYEFTYQGERYCCYHRERNNQLFRGENEMVCKNFIKGTIETEEINREENKEFLERTFKQMKSDFFQRHLFGKLERVFFQQIDAWAYDTLPVEKISLVDQISNFYFFDFSISGKIFQLECQIEGNSPEVTWQLMDLEDNDKAYQNLYSAIEQADPAPKSDSIFPYEFITKYEGAGEMFLEERMGALIHRKFTESKEFRLRKAFDPKVEILQRRGK